MLENAMAARGRPAKILTSNDLMTLQQFLKNLPFLKKNQQQALTLLQQANGIFNDKQLNLLKAADRDKNQFLKRQALIEQIKLKDKNQQPLLANETEILALLTQEMDQDNFFRLDRALESYLKIEKAALENRIRLENEHKREILQKSHKELTDAQKKRNAENQLKYALGGAVLAAWNKLNLSTENIDPEKVKNTIVNNQNFFRMVSNTTLYQYIHPRTENYFRSRELFIKVIEGLCEYDDHGTELYIFEADSHLKPQ